MSSLCENGVTESLALLPYCITDCSAEANDDGRAISSFALERRFKRRERGFFLSAAVKLSAQSTAEGHELQTLAEGLVNQMHFCGISEQSLPWSGTPIPLFHQTFSCSFKLWKGRTQLFHRSSLVNRPVKIRHSLRCSLHFTFLSLNPLNLWLKELWISYSFVCFSSTFCA